MDTKVGKVALGEAPMDRQEANEDTRRAWDANATFWDEHMGEGNDWVELLSWPASERLLALQAGERVLDVACGNGLTSRRMAALGAEVLAFDFSPEMIACARARPQQAGPPVEYRVLDATDVEALRGLGRERFDAILCAMALFDMADIQPLMQAAPRLLKAGGRFVFSVIHPCFNNAHTSQMAELHDEGGEVVTRYSIRVSGYLSSTIRRGAAIVGQPKAQLYFHRPLQELLGTAFASGLALDGLEEPSFPAWSATGKNPLSWSGHFHEIPPVLVGRLRPSPRVEQR